MIDNPEQNFEQKEIETGIPGSFALGFYFFAGVLLPVAALIAELGWRICAENFFDPIPTWWHVLLVSFVPITNLQTWLSFRRGYASRPGWLSFANGVSIFISLFYALIFAPVVPIAIIAILLVLLGLLPLAPLFSLVSGIMMRRKLAQLYPSARSPWFQWKALGAAFLFVVTAFGLAELNFTITRHGIAKANSTNAKTQQEGVGLLRSFGDLDYLLRLSYDGSGVVSPYMFFTLFAGEELTEQKGSVSAQAQKAYYRVTGSHYRQVPSPRGIRHWDRFEAFDDLDPNGSFRVSNNLSLSVSQIDGSVDADAALGYLEWTLVFKNESLGMQEAVSQIQLPPGAVVSRLTLWINGEEREAAFAKSAKVIEAYNSVTSKRRDPALVTVTGKDRVQLKCFPVPANGEMKVRLGITVPVVLESAAAGFMAMPYFQDRNFVVTSEHSIWVESKQDLEIANPAFRRERGDRLFGVRGRITDDQLIKIGSPIKISRSADITTAWAKDTAGSGLVVRQELREISKAPVKRIVFVIDASEQMAALQTQIADAVGKLPTDTATAIVLSGGNGLNNEIAAPNSFEGTPAQIADKIRTATFDGGTDAVSAIETAWEMAQTVPGSAIVWVHGPQIVELDSPARLTQLWTRRPAEFPVFSLQAGTGRNAVERVLNESDAVSTVLRFASVSDDLDRLFGNLISGSTSFEAVRTIDTTKAKPPASSKETSRHLIRLWAADEAHRLLIAGEEAKAVEVAVKNQLVTRVSGAVVLETQEQYDQFGLKPVEANSVPTIPEPEEYLLFAVVLLVLIYFGRRFRKFRYRTA